MRLIRCEWFLDGRFVGCFVGGFDFLVGIYHRQRLKEVFGVFLSQAFHRLDVAAEHLAEKQRF